MSRLLGLANEILYRIIDAVDPADLENFSASCPKIEILAAPALKRHLKLLEEYGEIKLGAWDGYQGQHPFIGLCEMVSEPQLRYYPTSLRIGGVLHWEDDLAEEEEIHEIKKLVAMYGNEILSVVRDCSYIKPDEVEAWHRAIVNAETDAAFGLLLTILPNIKSIIVTEDPEGMFTEMLSRIVQSYIDNNKHKCRALSLISKVEIAAYNPDGLSDCGDIGMELFLPFAQVPSLRSITGSFIRSEVRGHAYVVREDTPHRSNLKELDIDRSSICNDRILDFIRGISALERFSFTEGGFLVDYHIYEPLHIVAALTEFARHSLEYLRLTSCWVGMSDYAEGKMYCVGAFKAIKNCDLRGFWKLRDIHVDHDLFHDYSLSCSADCTKNYDLCECHPSRRLVDILPSSVETVKVGGSLSLHRAFVTLDGLAKLKEKRLPRLRRIELNSAITARKDVVEACKAVGVRLLRSKDIDADIARQRRAGADYKDGLL